MTLERRWLEVTFTVALNLREADGPGKGEQVNNDQGERPQGKRSSSIGGQDSGPHPRSLFPGNQEHNEPSQQVHGLGQAHYHLCPCLTLLGLIFQPRHQESQSHCPSQLWSPSRQHYCSVVVSTAQKGTVVLDE